MDLSHEGDLSPSWFLVVGNSGEFIIGGSLRCYDCHRYVFFLQCGGQLLVGLIRRTQLGGQLGAIYSTIGGLLLSRKLSRIADVEGEAV